ncbi:hypothetical protein BPY_06720 [Bifidobacterium psychraerophilum]|uniref:hypothetical protein n=1 Tax=Bifidobacterium psychraerophilum TaxID=218140 RepID=UPI003111DAD8
MMDPLISHVLGWFATTVLGGIVGFLASFLRKSANRDRALTQGMRVLLRARLIDIHERYVEHDELCPVNVKEEADKVYTAYHGLGGNGTGTHLHDEIMDAHISSDSTTTTTH